MQYLPSIREAKSRNLLFYNGTVLVGFRPVLAKFYQFSLGFYNINIFLLRGTDLKYLYQLGKYRLLMLQIHITGELLLVYSIEEVPGGSFTVRKKFSKGSVNVGTEHLSAARSGPPDAPQRISINISSKIISNICINRFSRGYK